MPLTRSIRRWDLGLLESVYETVLTYELMKRGLTVARQVPVTIRYRDIELDGGFKALTW